MLSNAKSFAVNILSEEQERIARQFSDSSTRAERFQNGEWDLNGVAPTLRLDFAAVFVCSLYRSIDVFTHSLIIGVIDAVEIGNASPLVYADGEYSQLKGIRT